MKSTSLEVLEKIRQNKYLSRSRLRVYECVVLNGQITMYETMDHLNARSIVNVSPRFSELERMGVIYDTGARRKNANGNNCVVWASTNQIPERLEIKKSTKQKLAEANQRIIELEKEVSDLLKMLKRLNPQSEMDFT